MFIRFNTDQNGVGNEWEKWVIAYLREGMQLYPSIGSEEEH
jgi:hypothetical protein